MVGGPYPLFLRAAALGENVEPHIGLDRWGQFCDAAEAEISSPGPLTDVPGLAAMASSGRLRCADYFDALGDASAAETARNRATWLANNHSHDEAQIEARRSRANALRNQGRYGEAMAEFTSIETAYDPAAEPLKFARCMLDQASLLEWLGDFDRSLVLLERAEQAASTRLADAPPMQSAFMTILKNLHDLEGAEEMVQLQTMRLEIAQTRGMVARRSGRLDDARRYFHGSRDDHEALGVVAAVDYQLMLIEALQGRGRVALARLDNLDAAMREHAGMRPKLPVLHWAAALVVLPDSPQWALDRVEAGIPTLEHCADYESLWKLQRTAADALIALGRPAEATARFLDAARTVDQLRRVPMGYRLESTYFADRRPMFADAVDHVATVENGPAALELTELAKSRSLATLVYGAQPPQAQGGLAERIDVLSREIDSIDFLNLRNENPDLLQRARLISERAEAIEQVRLADPRWRAMTEPAPVSPEAVVDALDGAVAISLFAVDDNIIATTIDATGVSVDRRSLDRTTRRELSAYYKNVRRGQDPYAYDLSGFGMIGLRDLLPASTCEHLLRHDRAVISPHGQLHLLPWSTLDIDGERLFQKVGVVTMPNLMCLPALAGAWAISPKAFVAGAPDYHDVAGLSPVDGDGVEWSAVRAAWQNSTTGTLAGGVVGSESTEAALHGALKADIDLLHVSCHGVIDHVEPSASALIAADGKVDAAEIALAGQSPAEVVLAACSTGYRPDAVGDLALSGDDAVGLPAAFIEAGARSVLMSVPKAHEATSVQFMAAYHAARAAGAVPVDAYRSTQIEMLDTADPAFWCGYVMYGSPERRSQ